MAAARKVYPSLSRRRFLGGLTAGFGASLLSTVPLLHAARAEEANPRFDPTSRYQARQVEGWEVLVHDDLLGSRRELGDQVLKLLGTQLYQVTRVVPAPALEKLKKIRVWAEVTEPHHPCMCYHPDPRWLREHGMNPDKARGVEIANGENFLKWTLQQPWMVLHELAHGYHHQVLGFDHPEVRAAFERAVQSKTYESILRISGKDDRHYALNNPQEYFAELSEAYFGTNDFYPFVRPELRRHDPEGLAMIEKAWGIPR